MQSSESVIEYPPKQPAWLRKARSWAGTVVCLALGAVLGEFFSRKVGRGLIAAICLFGAIVLGGLIAFAVQIWKGLVRPLFKGVQCPNCREWAFERVAVVSFGERFYKCQSCGQRCKRTDFDSPWLDASGKGDDEMYKPVPLYSRIRGREAMRKALKSALLHLILLAAFALTTIAATVVAGRVGWALAVALGAYVWFGFLHKKRTPKNVLPIRPVLWDHDVDSASLPRP